MLRRAIRLRLPSPKLAKTPGTELARALLSVHHMPMRAPLVALTLAFAGCVVSSAPPPPPRPVAVAPAERPQPPPPPPQPEPEPPPPPQRQVVVVPSHRPTLPAPPPAQRVLQVRELRAGRVFARVIYTREIEADDARVGRWIEVRGNKHDRDWDDRGGADMNVPEVRADVIYAREIHADFVQADEVHARKIKIRKR